MKYLGRTFNYCEYSNTLRDDRNHCIMLYDKKRCRWFLDIDNGVSLNIAKLIFEVYHTNHDFIWSMSAQQKAEFLTKYVNNQLQNNTRQ